MSGWRWTEKELKGLFRELFPDDDPDSPKARRRARILKAAKELFIEHGYRKASVDEIARRAEVAKGTVYLYFPTKASLLLHAITVEKQILFERMAPVFDPKVDGEERLRVYLREMLKVARELPLAARVLRQDNEFMVALEEMDSDLLARGEEIGLQWLSDLIEAAAPDELSREEKRERARVLSGLRYFTGLMLEERVRLGADLDSFADTFADILMYGLLQGPPPRDDE